MDELKAMRSFAQVVDSGSFVNAARALDVAPSVVTRAVAELEQHLGARLMTRTTRRTVLTHIGESYLERVRLILRGVDEASALARQAQAEPHGLLRVLAPPTFAAHQLARRLPRFHDAHPQVAVELTATGPVESLDPGHDITIVVRQPALDGDFVARPLARAHIVACATPEYLDRHGRPRHPNELGAHRLLTPALQRGLNFQRVDDAAPEADDVVTVAPARSPLHSVNEDLQQASALAGIGIAGLASFAVDQALHDHRLERVLPDWHLGELSIWACMPTRRHVPASTRAFMDFLVDEFGGARIDPWVAARASRPHLRLAA